jgi:hypothetical protein
MELAADGAGVVRLRFANTEAQRLALARASCFWEDPQLFNEVISLARFRGVRARAKEYMGHNMAVTKFLAFARSVSEAKEALAAEERALLDRLVAEGLVAFNKTSRQLEARRKLYLISHVATDRTSTNEHEELHARFFLDDAYRAGVEALWASLDAELRGALERHVLSLGYHASLAVDEFQAYLFTEAPAFWGARLAPHVEALLRAAAPLRPKEGSGAAASAKQRGKGP